jgi:hypothetical protein
MNAFEFSKHVIDVCSRYGFIQGIEILLLDEPIAKLKAVITSDIFISIFYNAETTKYSFSIIKHGKRAFGADNARNWHVHPFEAPDSHMDSPAVSLPDFLEMLASNKERWG